MESADETMLLVPGMTHDLGGGFIIKRLLPYRKKRMVGPFIFLDHMGPAEFTANSESDIRPHPHIGLSTLTYLYEGRIVHRDNTGQVQTILPGEVNWMTSGKGIAHSERAHADDYGKKVRMEGLQFWVALPDHLEDQDPSFRHYEKNQIPVYEGKGYCANVVTGKAFGLKSPVAVSSPSIFMDVCASEGCTFSFEAEDPNFEIAYYVLKSKLTHRLGEVHEGHIAILKDAKETEVKVETGTHFVVIGGEAFTTSRHISWNFVSSSREKLETAKKAWKEERFALIPGDDKERIPLGE